MENTSIYPLEEYNVSYSEKQAKGGALQLLEEREANELKDADVLDKKIFGSAENGAEHTCPDMMRSVRLYSIFT